MYYLLILVGCTDFYTVEFLIGYTVKMDFLDVTKEKAERNRKKVENGDIGEKDSKDSNESYYKNKNNRGYNRGRYNKGRENEKEREHFEKLTQNFMRGGKS